MGHKVGLLFRKLFREPEISKKGEEKSKVSPDHLKHIRTDMLTYLNVANMSSPLTREKRVSEVEERVVNLKW